MAAATEPRSVELSPMPAAGASAIPTEALSSGSSSTQRALFIVVGLLLGVIVSVSTWAITSAAIGGVDVVTALRPITGDPVAVPPTSTPPSEIELEPCSSWARARYSDGTVIDDVLETAGPALPLWSEFPIPSFDVTNLTDVRGSGSILPVRSADGSAPPRVVISTDVDNEVDDYFALVWALLSSVGDAPSLSVEAIYIEPFSFRWETVPKVIAYRIEQTTEDNRTDAEQRFLSAYQTTLTNMRLNGATPQTWVEADFHAIWCPQRSVAESLASAQRLLDLLTQADGEHADAIAALADTPLLAGQTAFLSESDPSAPLESDAVLDLIARGRAVVDPANDPLYVVSIGAPTNVAAALLSAPELVHKIIVVWDGGWPANDADDAATDSFNSGSDPLATRVLFESGVPLIYAPGFSTLMSLQLSRPDAEEWFAGRGPVSDELYERYRINPDVIPYGVGEYNRVGTSRIMWDVGCLMPFVAPDLVSWTRRPSVDMAQVEANCSGLLLPCSGTRRVDAAGSMIAANCSTVGLNGATCLDGYFVPSNQTRPEIVELTRLSGVASPSNVFRNLLVKLAEAQL